MKKRRQKPKQWFGCYQDSWKGHITAASYQHPAKFAKGLVERILDYMAEQGWIAKGDAIGDPFGGVRTGGIVAAYRGYQWIGVELEQKFVDLGEGNFELHRDRWKRLGVPMPICVQGDSRQFHFIVNAILSSPPYVSGGHHTDAMEGGNRNGRGQTRKESEYYCPEHKYNPPENSGFDFCPRCEAPEAFTDAVVGSPPYGGSLDDGGPEKAHPDGFKRSNNWTGYGKSDGQIATLKSGDVEQILGLELQPFQKQIIDAVVGSPPFLGCRSDTTSSGGGIAKKGYEGKEPARPSHKKLGERSYKAGGDKDRDPANIESLMPGTMAAVVSSPPYETIHAGAGGLNHLPARKDGQQAGRNRGASQEAMEHSHAGYGDTPGQIANTKKAPIGAILSSPPYMDSVNSESHGIDFSKAKKDYPGRVETPERVAQHLKGAEGMKYGDTPGQIGKLKAVVSSPPWEKNVEGGKRAGKFKGDAVLKSKRGKGASDAAVRAQALRDEQKTIGTSEGQIGQEKGETYWQAVAKVYHSCLLALKPGGVIALVIKDFCKDKRRMPLCDDTARLLTWLGFEEIERVHAMLTEEQIYHDLFEGEVSKKKERKSFFRRNYEKNMAPGDPRRIDFEEVLFFRKPL